MEIYSGIDIVENKRIENSIKKFGEKFLHRVFTYNEIKYCMEKVENTPCFAARFAAKEAFIKAYYKAFGRKLTYRSIEIKGQQGKPAKIFLHLNNKVIAPSESGFKYSLSISHERSYSVAMVIIYTS
jgi:holo-[acyl-carrier protein] synthase